MVQKGPSESAVVSDQLTKSANGAEEEARAVNEGKLVKASPPIFQTTKEVAGRVLDSSRQAFPTTFMNQGEAREAYMAGTFSHWERIRMVKSQKTLMDLPVGKHQFKYIVDDVWTHDTGLPPVSNKVGSQDNVIPIQQDALYCTALPCTALNSTALHCTAMH